MCSADAQNKIRKFPHKRSLVALYLCRQKLKILARSTTELLRTELPLILCNNSAKGYTQYTTGLLYKTIKSAVFYSFEHLAVIAK